MSSFNRGPVKGNFEHYSTIYDCIIVGLVSFVSALSFGRTGDAVCRGHGRLRVSVVETFGAKSVAL